MIPLSRSTIARMTKQMIISGRADEALKQMAEKQGFNLEEMKTKLLLISTDEIAGIIEKYLGSYDGIFDWRT